MKKEFIPYKYALELQKIGFNEICIGEYDFLLNITSVVLRCAEINNNGAPTFSQAFSFFRKKGIQNVIMPKITPSNTVVYYRYEGKAKKNWDNCFATYEEAQIECIKQSIEICKKK